MNAVTTLTISPDGRTATALHTDAFDLGKLGRQKMKRASTIEFNEATQLWEVRVPRSLGPKTYVLFSHKSRETCLKWEVAYFAQ